MTGVQTCALPICGRPGPDCQHRPPDGAACASQRWRFWWRWRLRRWPSQQLLIAFDLCRSGVITNGPVLTRAWPYDAGTLFSPGAHEFLLQRQQATFAVQDLLRLQSGHDVAQGLGQELGAGQILLRGVSQSSPQKSLSLLWASALQGCSVADKLWA